MNNDPIRLCKIFNFEMAHALLNYDGSCKNIHGHSYILYVTVIGKPLQEENHPHDGMVIDFKDLKKIVKENVVNQLDHALVLNKQTPSEVILILQKMYEKVIIKPYQPTCENLLLEMSRTLIPLFPDEVKLYQLKLYETASSYAEWYNEKGLLPHN